MCEREEWSHGGKSGAPQVNTELCGMFLHLFLLACITFTLRNEKTSTRWEDMTKQIEEECEGQQEN